MKKRIATALAMLLLLMGLVPVLTAAKPLPLRVEVNTNRIYFPDEQPYVDKAQRVQVPVRFVSEALGAKVGWNAATKTVTVDLDSNRVVLVLGSKKYTVNGVEKQMDTAAERVGGRTFVPLRFISEGLGASVKWDSAVRTVYINTAGFDPSEVKQGSDQVVVEDMYGFKVRQNTGSMLEASKGPYDRFNNNKNKSLMNLLIILTLEGADYEAQVQEVEDILIQKIDEKTVKSIIKYVQTKTTIEPELKMKIFTDDTYEIFVGADINSDISITVFYK
ncbi:copper amine oxidase N-terminal domain-containing protein [Paenibacillus woosongensis]|uniref:Copper amine oxidase N-terminal domain-containing protein n=1 Tax=Paenibacillus woosongensis TaxID=307580 RepID=A0A7X2YYH4_9BACL|nr:copper amine oxidase N-terminal domain-containing protein [Paenibacillus woosongensis]MUG44356.1 copper amine oxidase N-terminal domain-containing protein [Paenibacillus woosongensis]